MASASTSIIDKQPPLNCPRCDSSNTKFCYYNNYSLSQPRHFCKACKRYWTRGGTLRNVPVGGACRKNKRLKTSSSSSSVNATNSTALSQNPRLLHNSINPSSSALNLLHFSNLDNYHRSFSAPHLDNIDDAIAAAGLGFSPSSGLLSHVGDISLNSNQFHRPAISFDRDSQPLLGGFETSLMMMTTPRKEMKMDGGLNRLCQNQTSEQQIDLSNFSDPSNYWNSSTTTTATGNWHDPTSNGSSIASLF